MSTYWYFECLDHTPPLRSNDEFTQHTDDDWYRQAVALAAVRPVPADDGSYWNRKYASDRDQSRSYFRMNALKFLHEHPTCRLGAVSEYGNRRALSQPTPSEPTREQIAQAIADAWVERKALEHGVGLADSAADAVFTLIQKGIDR